MNKMVSVKTIYFRRWKKGFTCVIYNGIDKEKICIQSPKNRFYGLWSSQRPPVNVGLNYLCKKMQLYHIPSSYKKIGDI